MAAFARRGKPLRVKTPGRPLPDRLTTWMRWRGTNHPEARDGAKVGPIPFQIDTKTRIRYLRYQRRCEVLTMSAAGSGPVQLSAASGHSVLSEASPSVKFFGQIVRLGGQVVQSVRVSRHQQRGTAQTGTASRDRQYPSISFYRRGHVLS